MDFVQRIIIIVVLINLCCSTTEVGIESLLFETVQKLWNSTLYIQGRMFVINSVIQYWMPLLAHRRRVRA